MLLRISYDQDLTVSANYVLCQLSGVSLGTPPMMTRDLLASTLCYDVPMHVRLQSSRAGHDGQVRTFSPHVQAQSGRGILTVAYLSQ